MPFKVTPPKIRVYYLRPVKRRVSRRSFGVHRLFLPGLFLLVLLTGIGTGTFLGWTSRFGQADLEPPEIQQLRGEPLPPSPVIPLEQSRPNLTVVANLLPILIEQYRHQPTAQEIRAVRRKEALRDYLAIQKSPLAEDDAALDALLRARNMKMILAISFVESNMCKKQIYNNCSGIGGSKIRQYPDFSGWVDDFDDLLERRYKDLPVEKFLGYYVQPGSQNWVDGVYQILGDLEQRHIE